MAFASLYFFIHEYFPNTYYVPATVIGSEDTKIRKSVCDLYACGVYSPVEEIDINQSKQKTCNPYPLALKELNNSLTNKCEAASVGGRDTVF